MTGQSKTGSALEAFANIAAGVAVALVSQIVIFGYYGIEISYALNVKMTLWFTSVSLARQFILRRIFNRITSTKGVKRTWDAVHGSRWVNLSRDGRAK